MEVLFTAILIVSSIGTFTAATAVTQFFIEETPGAPSGQAKWIMNEMNNHVIICGRGSGEKAASGTAGPRARGGNH